MTYEIVVPTVGRPSLARLLHALDGQVETRIVVVDDRAGASTPLDVPSRVEVVRGRASGPAAARNTGWRATTAEWVAFLDDDVLPPAGWAAALEADLAACGEDIGEDIGEGIGGVQGRIRVPLPDGRPPTDWERNVAGLEQAAWATADMAYRRAALEAVGGFDERFPRAYREDADLALRVEQAGWRLVRGNREVTHVVRPADRWVSLRLQKGNADDALMVAVHGRDWRERAGAPPGRKRRHLAVTAAAAGAVAALTARRPAAALVAAGGWLAGTADLAWARIAPGPRTAEEVATMLATSAVMPPVASAWTLAGLVRWRRELAGRFAPLANVSASRRTAVAGR